LVCAGILVASIAQNFDAGAKDKQEYTITQPATGKMIVRVPESKVKVYGGRFFKLDGVLRMTDDSLYLNNVRLQVLKSTDSLYHIAAYKYSNGADENAALQNVNAIRYGISQQDSMISLDRGFALQRGTRFRNQSVTVTIQVPVGKRIVITNSVNHQLNYSFHFGNRSDWNFDEDWNNRYENWSSDVEYVMTAGGLERVNKKHEDEGNDDGENATIEKFKKSKEELQKQYDKKQKEAEDLKKELDKPVDSTHYQYKKATSYLVVPAPVKEQITDKAATTENSDISEESSRLTLMHIVL